MKKYLFILPILFLGIFLLPHSSFAATNYFDNVAGGTSGTRQLSGGGIEACYTYTGITQTITAYIAIKIISNTGIDPAISFNLQDMTASTLVAEYKLPVSGDDQNNGLTGLFWLGGKLTNGTAINITLVHGDCYAPNVYSYGTDMIAMANSNNDTVVFSLSDSTSTALCTVNNSCTLPVPTVSFLYPTNGSTVSAFTSYQLLISNVTSTDIYTGTVDNYIFSNDGNMTYYGQQFCSTGSATTGNTTGTISVARYNTDGTSACTVIDSSNGIPSNTTSTIIESTANILQTSLGNLTRVATETSTWTYLIPTNGTPINITNVLNGTVTIATTTFTTVQNNSADTQQICTRPSDWLNAGSDIDYIGCAFVNIFVYPHSFSQNLAQAGFNQIQSDVPFSFVYSAVNGFESSSVSLESATSSNLAFSFLSSAGKSGIIPTSSISVISQTAYSSLLATAGGTSQSDLFTVEDDIFYFFLLCLIIGLTIKLL
jgi:hypothetical protein